MKFFPHILAAVFAALAGVSAAQAQPEFQSFGLDGRRVHDFTFTASGSILVVADTGCFRSEGDGLNWTRLKKYSDPYSGMPVSIFSLSDDSIRAFGGTFVETSADSGKTWKRTSLTGKSLRTVVTMGNGSLLAGDLNGILRSTDQGTTWTLLGSAEGLPSEFFDVGAIMVTANGARAIAANQGITGGLVYTTADTGKHWKKVYAAGTDVGAVCMIDPLTYVIAVGTTLKRTTNSGGAWSTVSGVDGMRFTTFYVDSIGVFAGTDHNGVWASFDKGVTWTKWGATSIPTRSITGIRRTTYSRLIVATDSGLFFAGLMPADVPPEPSVPTFSVRVTPNPAHDRVRFSFGTRCHDITATIYDQRGVTVATICNHADRAEAEWDAHAASPGVYYCVVSSGNETTTGTIVIE